MGAWQLSTEGDKCRNLCKEFKIDEINRFIIPDKIINKGPF